MVILHAGVSIPKLSGSGRTPLFSTMLSAAIRRRAAKSVLSASTPFLQVHGHSLLSHPEIGYILATSGRFSGALAGTNAQKKSPATLGGATRCAKAEGRPRLRRGARFEPTTLCGAPDFESYLYMCPQCPQSPNVYMCFTLGRARFSKAVHEVRQCSTYWLHDWLHCPDAGRVPAAMATDGRSSRLVDGRRRTCDWAKWRAFGPVPFVAF